MARPAKKPTTTVAEEKAVAAQSEAVQAVSNSVSSLSKLRQKAKESKKLRETTSGKTVDFVLTGDSTRPEQFLKPKERISIPSEEELRQAGVWNYYEPLLEKYKDVDGKTVYLTGEVTLRYVEGKRSIFEELQGDGEVTIKSITIQNGSKTINKDRENTLYRYFMLSDRNADKPLRDGSKKALFKMYNPLEKAQQDVKRIQLHAEFMKWLREASEEEKFAMAIVNNITPDDDDSAITDLRLIDASKEDPKRFLQYIDSDKLEIHATMKIAMDTRVFTIDAEKIYWKNGQLMMVVPMGENAYQFLIRYVEKPEGKATYNEIVSRLG